MSRDPRLDAWCEILRIALRAYLDALARHWVPDDSSPTGQRAAASIGTRGEPEPIDRATVRELLETDTAGPLTRIAQALALTPGEEALVAAAWWAQTDPQFAFALGCAHDDGARRHASSALVRVLLEPFGIDVPPLATDRGRLVRGGVLQSGAGATEPLAVTATAAELFAAVAPESLGEEGTRKAARGGAKTVARGDARAAAREDTHVSLDADGGPPARLAAARDGLVRHLLAPDPGIVMLRGPAGIGRHALAISAAGEAGLVPVANTRPPRELALLARLGVALPIVDAEALEALNWGREDGPLVVIAGPDAASGGAHVVDLPGPDFAERERTWSAALERAGLDADPQLLGSLSARFAFTERDVDDVIRRATRDARWSDRPLDGTAIWEAARRQPEHALSKLAALVAPGFTLDDLVVDADCRAKLSELVSHVELQHVVLDEWGFRRRLPRGPGRDRAVRRAVRAPARRWPPRPSPRALRHDLYRVDLSAVVQQVHRRDREEPRRGVRRGASAPARSCSSTRPTRCSASAPRSRTRTTATRTSRSTTCCSASRRSPGW